MSSDTHQDNSQQAKSTDTSTSTEVPMPETLCEGDSLSVQAKKASAWLKQQAEKDPLLNQYKAAETPKSRPQT